MINCPFSYHYHHAEVNVEYVETEIGARCGARAFIYAVGYLFFVLPFQTEYAERDIERHIILHKNAHAGAEIERALCDVGACVFGLAVVQALETRRTAAET